MALVAVLPADDHEFLPLDAFDLEPGLGPLTLVGRLGLLRDDALAALLANRLEQRLALADDMVAVKDRRAGRLEERRKSLLALDVGKTGDLLTLIDQQIEGIEGEIGIAAFQRRLKQLEIGLAPLIERDRLAVDQATAGQLGGSPDDRTEFVAPVIAFARPGRRRAARGRNQQPVTVIFIFVNPLIPARHGVDQCRQLRRLEFGRRDAGLAPRPPSLAGGLAVGMPDVRAGGDL